MSELPKDPIFCKDCKWTSKKYGGWKFSKCRHPKVLVSVGDFLTGDPCDDEDSGRYCSNLREHGICGVSAKLFEAKDAPAPSTPPKPWWRFW